MDIQPKSDGETAQKECRSLMYRVRLVDELEKKKHQIEAELASGNRTNEMEYRLLIKGIERLKQNYKVGKRIPKRYRKPYKYYERKYGITNLWKFDVSKDWRMIYTVIGDEVEIISFVLDLMNHKKYERRFGY